MSINPSLVGLMYSVNKYDYQTICYGIFIPIIPLQFVTTYVIVVTYTRGRLWDDSPLNLHL